MPGDRVKIEGFTLAGREEPLDDLNAIAQRALEAIRPDLEERRGLRVFVMVEEDLEPDMVKSGLGTNLFDPRPVVTMLLRALETYATPDLAARVRARLADQSRPRRG